MSMASSQDQAEKDLKAEKNRELKVLRAQFAALIFVRDLAIGRRQRVDDRELLMCFYTEAKDYHSAGMTRSLRR